MSFTRKMFRILTKRILTCLFLKKGLFSILVQNSQKVTKKVLVFRKVARSCSLTKKLLKILKVAEKLPSRILERPSPGQEAKNMNCFKRLTINNLSKSQDFVATVSMDNRKTSFYYPCSF